MNALIRYHFKIDPSQLTDQEFAATWNDLVFALNFETKRKML